METTQQRRHAKPMKIYSWGKMWEVKKNNTPVYSGSITQCIDYLLSITTQLSVYEAIEQKYNISRI